MKQITTSTKHDWTMTFMTFPIFTKKHVKSAYDSVRDASIPSLPAAGLDKADRLALISGLNRHGGGADGADGADVYHQSSFCLELFSPCFFFWLCRQTSLIFIPNLNFKDFSRIKTLVAMPNFKPQNHIKSTSDVRVSYKISNFSNWS